MKKWRPVNGSPHLLLNAQAPIPGGEYEGYLFFLKRTITRFLLQSMDVVI
jgi:hypothetical protein